MRCLLVWALWPALTWAQTPLEQAQSESTYLIEYLNVSGCRFNRNGSWYSAREAADHLRQKYAYLLKQGGLDSAEAFIARAASTSGASGKPYRVQCGVAAPVDSGPWLQSALVEYRARSR